MTIEIDRNEIMDMLIATTDQHQPTILIGPPGTGKSTLVAEYAKRISRPFYKFAAHPDALESEITLAYLPIDGKWQAVPKAMLWAWGHGTEEAPGVLCVDDVHNAGPGMMSALYTALDAGVGGSYMHPTGQMLYPKEGYRPILTMNGDLNSLDPAVRDRLALTIPVMEPSDEMYEALRDEIQEMCVADYTNNLTPLATYRQWATVSKLWDIVGLSKAVMLAVGDSKKAQEIITTMAVKMDNEDAQQALDTILAASPSVF